MNWTWNVRGNDGAMNGLGFAECTTAGGFSRGLARADLERTPPNGA